MELRERNRAPVVRRWAWRVAAVPLGALVSLSFPEADAWWLAHVGLVPVLALVAAAETRRDALWRSWFGGTGFFLALYHWVLPTLGPFVAPAALAMAATWIPVGLVVHAALRAARDLRGTLVALAVVPSMWVLVEVARSWDVLGGSWGFLGLSQWRTPPVLALAALGGVWLVSWVLACVNTGLALALQPGRAPAVRVVAVALPAALLLAGATWHALRPDPDVRGEIRIAGVQPGVVHDGEERLVANEELTRALDVAGDDIDLIVWGQSSVAFDPMTDPEVRARLEQLTAEVGVDVYVNVDARRDDGRIAKSGVLFRPDAGLDDTYDKQRLVPFGEYIPLRPVFGWVARFTDAAAEDRVPGGEITTMRIAGVTVGPLISYESTFPDMRRSVARLGAELTLVQGASTTFQGTWAQPQQASFEAVRAVETGRAAVLVTVSGTSAAFDARGEQLAWFANDRTGTFLVDVPVAVEDTLYVRVGDWVPVVSLTVVLLVGGVALHRRRTRRRGTAATGDDDDDGDGHGDGHDNDDGDDGHGHGPPSLSASPASSAT